MNQNICVVELFYSKVKRIEDTAAIIFHDREVSYSELDRLSGKCANYLNKLYSEEQCIVPFVMDRSIDMIVLIWGIIKSGRAFLPIDNSFPNNRIKYICNNSGITRIICNAEHKDNLEKALDGIELFAFDINKIINEEESFATNVKKNNDVMYVLYTSGSTGNPKGVQVSREAFVNFVDAISEKIGLSEGKRILASTSISFDISILETVVSLILGMTIVLANEHEQKTPRLLGSLIEKYNVDVVQMTPSLMNLLISYYKNVEFLNNVGDVLIGGEPLPGFLFETISNKINARLFNMYGPTEATIWCCIKQLSKGQEITIGKPLKGNEIYIINEENIPQPDGLEGEICIGGKQLAKGYIGNEQLTAEKFITNPADAEKLMYRTGDKGKILPNGEIQFLGRIDNQVKINGHRIELEEIEKVIAKNSKIKQATVVVKEKDEVNKFLYAYYISDTEVSDSELTEFLRNYLPEYMVPSIYIRMESFPLMQNGKVDRKLLREIEFKNGQTDSEIEDFDMNDFITDKIKCIIRSQISKKQAHVNVQNNSVLKSIGVNSILMVGIIISLEVEFGFQFSSEDFYTNKFVTVQDLKKYVSQKLGTSKI